MIDRTQAIETQLTGRRSYIPRGRHARNRNGFRVDSRVSQTVKAVRWAGFRNGEPRWEPCAFVTTGTSQFQY